MRPVRRQSRWHNLPISVEDPTRPGSTERPELGDGVRTWHLRGSRNNRTGPGAVRRPRHFVIYRVDSEVVVIGRVLHDAMELRRHGGTDPSWE
jgi:toxin ParE1/3/4